MVVCVIVYAWGAWRGQVVRVPECGRHVEVPPSDNDDHGRVAKMHSNENPEADLKPGLARRLQFVLRSFITLPLLILLCLGYISAPFLLSQPSRFSPQPQRVVMK